MQEEKKKSEKNKMKRKKQEYIPESDSEEDEEEMEIENIDVTKTKKQLQEQNQLQSEENPYENNNNTGDLEEEEEEEDEDQQKEGEDYDSLNVKFNFCDPNEKQYHSVKNLLNSYLDGLSFKSSELADIVINQVELGTMICVDDEDLQQQQQQQKTQQQTDQQVIAFVTILNVNTYSEEQVCKEILVHVLEKSQKLNSEHKELASILQQSKIGLLLNERILNCAPQLIPTLHQQLIEDVKWMNKEQNKLQQQQKQQKQQIEQESDSVDMNLDYLLILSKVFKEQDLKPMPKKKQNINLQEYIYPKFEDYMFLQKATQFFLFEAQSTKSGTGVTNLEKDHKEKQICYRSICLLKFKDYLNCLQEIQQELVQQF